jgi:ubiquinone/menaquinone biosynthesis C-methylase UbiE
MASTAATKNDLANAALNVDKAVRDRYNHAAQQTDAKLCCPVNYSPRLLEMLPTEIRERDYGCGDPSRHVLPGETVLDLGSGGGKVCYIAAQVVGPRGKVIGVDCNDDMLALACKYLPEMERKLGGAIVEFRKGKIQDLQLDLELLDEYLTSNPVQNSGDWLKLEEHAAGLRADAPLIAANSIDVVISNCVLNLVRRDDRRQLFREMARVLKPGGRVVVSDIVASRDVPAELQRDARLWSGCISGAFREEEFLAAFEDAGFYGIDIIDRQAEPWLVVERIEFRSVTVRAYHGKLNGSQSGSHAVVYKGPWKAVVDDDGRQLVRGQPTSVGAGDFQTYARPPYAPHVIAISDTPADNPQAIDPANGNDCCGRTDCC